MAENRRVCGLESESGYKHKDTENMFDSQESFYRYSNSRPDRYIVERNYVASGSRHLKQNLKEINTQSKILTLSPIHVYENKQEHIQFSQIYFTFMI